MTAATKTITSPRLKTADDKPDAFVMAITNARIAQAVASSTAAHAIAMVPSGVLAMPRSFRIRTSTGNAVMLMAIPMNNAKAVNGVTGEPKPG